MVNEVASMTMSLKDKLAFIDHEIRTLHKFCIDKGYTPQQIEEKASPVLKPVTALTDKLKRARSKRRGLTLTLLKCAVIVAVASAIVYCDPAYRFVCAYSRLGVLQLLPFWDWSQLYNADCIIHNPYFVGISLSADDCQMCVNTTRLDHFSEVSQANVSDYLKRDYPIIVTDAMDTWPALQMFSVAFIADLYKSEASLRQVMPCSFVSDRLNVLDDPRVLLARVAEGEVKEQWFAQWMNCDKNAARVLRHYVRRPYFLPPMVEMGESNWLFVSSNTSSDKDSSDLKDTNIDLPVALFAQVTGNSLVTLSPLSLCETNCSLIHAQLKQGEILMVPQRLWTLQYTPSGSGESIAVGLGGIF